MLVIMENNTQTSLSKKQFAIGLVAILIVGIVGAGVFSTFASDGESDTLTAVGCDSATETLNADGECVASSESAAAPSAEEIFERFDCDPETEALVVSGECIKKPATTPAAAKNTLEAYDCDPATETLNASGECVVSSEPGGVSVESAQLMDAARVLRELGFDACGTRLPIDITCTDREGRRMRVQPVDSSDDFGIVIDDYLYYADYRVGDPEYSTTMTHFQTLLEQHGIDFDSPEVI